MKNTQRDIMLNTLSARIAQQFPALIKEALDIHTKTCVNCYYFINGPDVCTKAAPHSTPPAKVIVVGCPAWEENIPF